MSLHLRDLVAGRTYFMVTYPDATLACPIVITYQYLGKDIHGAPAAGSESEFYFKYLPAFQYEDGPPVDDGPTIFSEAQVRRLNSIDGLLEELNEVRNRILRE